MALMVNLCKAARVAACVILIGVLLSCTAPPKEAQSQSTSEERKTILFIAGQNTHSRLEHQHGPGVELLAKHLEKGLPNVETIIATGGWPDDQSLFEGIDSVVIYCDGGSGHVMNHNLDRFDRLLDQKVGFVFLHYAVEVPKNSSSSARMLRASGGYFETHWSVNPRWTASFEQLPKHPITRGVEPFAIQDEWYFNMRFQPEMAGVTPILSAVPPLGTMDRSDGPHSGNAAVREMVKERRQQHVGWAYERPDGGRGFGLTGGHYHRNWADDNFRKTVLNAIAWTANIEVPEAGVSVANAHDSGFVSLDYFSVPDDLEVTVWAKSPMFFNPTNMDVDAEGRIWVAEGRNYRRSQLSPEGDRITVMQDSDGDGIADKSHVFVQDKELASPLGIGVIDNQIIVAQPPNLIVYTDVDRDLKFDPSVDKRENILSGFNGRDHDHGLHSVTFGPDGKWYFNVGNAGSGEITDRSGKTFRIGSYYKNSDLAGLKSDDGHVYVGGTAFRMNPDGTDLTPIGFNFRNSYEQTINSMGDVFQNDNDDPPNCRTTWLMEYGNLGYNSTNGKLNWQLERRPGQSSQVAHWRQEDPGVIPAGDVYGGGSPTGIAFYENGALGEKYRGLLLSAEPARNVIFGYFPQAKGAGYLLKSKRFDFLSSNVDKQYSGSHFKAGEGGEGSTRESIKALFRPSDVVVGPDGAIYIADWFDARIGGHATYDKGGSGTIYRIAPKGFKPKIPSLNLETIAGQIKALESPAANVRALGYSALVKRGQSAVSAVGRLLQDENPYIQARAIWVLVKLGEKGASRVEALLEHPDEQIRVTAWRALRRENRHFQQARKVVLDPSAAVRREVALAMRDVSFSKSRDILLSLARSWDGEDRWYLEALGAGAEGHEKAFYHLLKNEMGEAALSWDRRFEGLSWRLHTPEALKDFKVRALSSSLDENLRLRALTAIAFTEGSEAIRTMVEVANTAEPGIVEETAQWWLRHPHHEAWAEHELLAIYFRPHKIDTDYLVPKQLGVKTAQPKIDQILALKGDAERGGKMMGSCLMCHEIKGQDGGLSFGPDLSAYGKTQSRSVIAEAIVDPSSDIAHAFDSYEYYMKNGKKVQGIQLSATGKVYSVKVFGGQVLVLAKDAIEKRRKIWQSYMVPADKLGLEAQDIRDIVEYMKTSS